MTLKSALLLKTACAIWQKAVKSFSRLSELLIRAVPMIVGGQSRGWVKAMFHFSRLVTRIRKNQGSRGLAIFLKASQLIIQRVISGSKLDNSRLAGSAVSVTNSGIPRWIPSNHRKLILKGSVPTITFYLVLCTLYRVLDYKGKLSLSTISEQGVPLDTFLPGFKVFLSDHFFPWLLSFGITPCPSTIDITGGLDKEACEVQGNRIFRSLAPIFHWNYKSGPNSIYTKLLSIGNAWVDLIALYERTELLARIEAIRYLVGADPLASLPFFRFVSRHLEKWLRVVNDHRKKKGLAKLKELPLQYDVGALSVVEEPGKKRIVAMVDVWTQWTFYPLHRFIFDKVLFFIKEDGTFNQVKPVDTLLERAGKVGRSHYWSFDLSAATDRLPIVIQILVLAGFVSEEYAHLWASILVHRTYRVPREYSSTFGKAFRDICYKVGQPMGAYSSWAMLAITHHALVQYSAWKVGHGSWFSWYAVLGDDVVICDNEVANEYVNTMNVIGVKIGFHKSIISTNSSLEFAKRFYYKGKLISGLSLGGIAVGWLGPGYIPELIATVQSKLGVKLSLYHVARFMGIGYKAATAAVTRQLQWLPKTLRSAILLLTRPGAPFGVSDFLSWYTLATAGGQAGEMMWAALEIAFQSLWTEIRDTIFIPTIKRSHTVIDGFFSFKSKVKSKDGKKKRMVTKDYLSFIDNIFGKPPEEYITWFRSVIVPAHKRLYDKSQNEAGVNLEASRKVFYKTYDFSKSVALLEKALSLLALTPTEVGLHRREQENPFSNSLLDSVISPRSVKRWNSLSRLTTRKSTPKYVPRVMWSTREPRT